MSSSHAPVLGAGSVESTEDPFSSLLLLAEQADDEAAARKQEQALEKHTLQRKIQYQEAGAGLRSVPAAKLSASTSGAGLVSGQGPSSTHIEVDAPARPGGSSKGHHSAFGSGTGAMAHMSFNGAGSDTQRSQQETSQEDPVTLKMALNHENEDDAKSGSASGAAAGGGMLGLMPGSFAPYGLLPQLGVQSFGMAPGMMASMLPGMLAPVAGGQPQPSISTPGQTHNADASHGGGAGSQSQQPMVVTGMPLADYAQQWQLAQQQQQMMAMYMAYWQMYMASMYANMGLGAGVMPGAGAGFGIMPGMNPQDMMAQMQSMQGMMMAASMGGAAPGAAGAPPMFGMQPAMPGGTQMPAFMMGMPGMAAANMQMSAIPAPVPAPAPGPMPGIPGLPGMPPTTGTGLPMLPPGIQICDSLPVSLAPVPDMQGVEESDDHEDSYEDDDEESPGEHAVHDDMQTQQPQQHTHAMPSDSMPPGMSAPMHDNISAPAGSQVAAVSAPAPGSAHAQPHPMANGPVQSLPGPVQSLPIPAGGYAHGHGAKRQRDGVVIPGPVGQAGVATAGVPAPPGPAPVLPAGAQPAGIPGVPRPLGMPGQVPVSAAPQYQAGMHMPMSMSMSPGAMMSLAAMQQKRGRRATKEQKISGDKMCKNCGTKATPFWRKDKNDGKPLCNACGLYFSKNDAHRPKLLWKAEDGTITIGMAGMAPPPGSVQVVGPGGPVAPVMHAPAGASHAPHPTANEAAVAAMAAMRALGSLNLPGMNLQGGGAGGQQAGNAASAYGGSSAAGASGGAPAASSAPSAMTLPANVLSNVAQLLPNNPQVMAAVAAAAAAAAKAAGPGGNGFPTVTPAMIQAALAALPGGNALVLQQQQQQHNHQQQQAAAQAQAAAAAAAAIGSGTAPGAAPATATGSAMPQSAAAALAALANQQLMAAAAAGRQAGAAAVAVQPVKSLPLPVAGGAAAPAVGQVQVAQGLGAMPLVKQEAGTPSPVSAPGPAPAIAGVPAAGVVATVSSRPASEPGPGPAAEAGLATLPAQGVAAAALLPSMQPSAPVHMDASTAAQALVAPPGSAVLAPETVPTAVAAPSTAAS